MYQELPGSKDLTLQILIHNDICRMASLKVIPLSYSIDSIRFLYSECNIVVTWIPRSANVFTQKLACEARWDLINFSENHLTCNLLSYLQPLFCLKKNRKGSTPQSYALDIKSFNG